MHQKLLQSYIYQNLAKETLDHLTFCFIVLGLHKGERISYIHLRRDSKRRSRIISVQATLPEVDGQGTDSWIGHHSQSRENRWMWLTNVKKALYNKYILIYIIENTVMYSCSDSLKMPCKDSNQWITSWNNFFTWIFQTKWFTIRQSISLLNAIYERGSFKKKAFDYWSLILHAQYCYVFFVFVQKKSSYS